MKPKGFTLVELLIALMIFSLVSVGALASLNHMIRAREQQLLHHETKEQVDLAYGQLMQDMIWFHSVLSVSSGQLDFKRTVTQEIATLLEVHYLLKDGKLYRRTGADPEAPVQLLLSDVTALRLSWLLESNQWVGVFDQANLDAAPLLFRLQFNATQLGEVTWVFSLPHL